MAAEERAWVKVASAAATAALRWGLRRVSGGWDGGLLVATRACLKGVGVLLGWDGASGRVQETHRDGRNPACFSQADITLVSFR